MAAKRKVDNLMALAVLATVVQRPMHRYEIASLMRARGKDQDMDVKWGSLYTVVQNLEKYGFIAAVESTRAGGRPERTVYGITDAGREEMADWVRELLAVPDNEASRFEAGLSIAGVLHPDEVTTMLRRRAAALDGQIAELRSTLADATHVPRLFLIEDEYRLALREAEATWVRRLLTELADGTLPGLAQWRGFHESGTLPTGLDDFAEGGNDPDTD